MLLLACVACGETGQDKPTLPQATVDKSFEVQWFEGSTEQAFATAKAQNKPLFLYWGAKWCPPCHELKATVFSEPNFVQKSRQFIALYLDGDSQGAQKQAEHFKVMGYPTLVVFNAEGLELTRIPNGLDLAAYATVLDSVLENLQPVQQLLASAVNGQALNAAECQALAQHSWSQDAGELTTAELLTGLENAQQQCPSQSQADRAALFLRQLILAQTEQLDLTADQLAAYRTQLMALLQQDRLLTANFYLFLEAGEPLAVLFGNEEQPDQDIVAGFEQHYARLAADPQQSLFKRIQLSRVLFALRDKYSTTDSLRQANLELAAQARKVERSDSKFHATINAAGNLLREVGELQAAKELLLAESEKSKYSYYFMSELAEIEQLLDNDEQAVLWLEKAYLQSRGPATSFQWGVNYLRGLLELAPNEATLIEQQFRKVFAELPEDTVMYQRSRVRLAALQEDLTNWRNGDSQRDDLYQQLSSLCRLYQAKVANE